MTSMAGLFASGRAVDVVLAVMLAEAAWLVGRRGWPIADALLTFLPGALILVALRAALTQLDWRWIALPLILSFPVHLADVARRRRAGPGGMRASQRIRRRDDQPGGRPSQHGPPSRRR